MAVYTRTSLGRIMHLSIPVTMANLPMTDYLGSYWGLRPMVYDAVSLHHVASVWDYDAQFHKDLDGVSIIYSAPDAECEVDTVDRETIKSVASPFQISGFRNTLVREYQDFIEWYNDFYNVDIPGGGYWWTVGSESTTDTDVGFLLQMPDYARVFDDADTGADTVITQNFALGLTNNPDRRINISNWFYFGGEPWTSFPADGSWVGPGKPGTSYKDLIGLYEFRIGRRFEYFDMGVGWYNGQGGLTYFFGGPAHIDASVFNGQVYVNSYTPNYTVDNGIKLKSTSNYVRSMVNSTGGGYTGFSVYAGDSVRYYHKLGQIPLYLRSHFEETTTGTAGDTSTLYTDPHLTHLLPEKYGAVFSQVGVVTKHNVPIDTLYGQLGTTLDDNTWVYSLPEVEYESEEDWLTFSNPQYAGDELVYISVSDRAFRFVVPKKSNTKDVSIFKQFYGWNFDSDTMTASLDLTKIKKFYTDSGAQRHPDIAESIGGRELRIIKIYAPNLDTAHQKIYERDYELIDGTSFEVEDNLSETDNIYYFALPDLDVASRLNFSCKSIVKTVPVEPPRYTCIGGSQWLYSFPDSYKISDTAYGKDLDFGTIGRDGAVFSDIIDGSSNPGGYNHIRGGKVQISEMNDGNIQVTVFTGNPWDTIFYYYMKIIYRKVNPWRPSCADTIVEILTEDDRFEEPLQDYLCVYYADNSNLQMPDSTKKDAPKNFYKMPTFYKNDTIIDTIRNVYDIWGGENGQDYTMYNNNSGAFSNKLFTWTYDTEPNYLLFPVHEIRHNQGALIVQTVKNDEFRVNIDDYYGQYFGSNRGLT